MKSVLLVLAMVCVCPEQVSEVGLGEEVLAVPPSHKGVSRRLIFTSAHGLVELPSSLSWLFRTRPPFSGPLLPSVLAEILRYIYSLSAGHYRHSYIRSREINF